MLTKVPANSDYLQPRVLYTAVLLRILLFLLQIESVKKQQSLNNQQKSLTQSLVGW